MASTSNAIYLREIGRSDVSLINAWRRDREIADSLLGTFRHVNEETDQDWFDRYMASRDCNVRLGIVLKDSDSLIGVIYLLNIDWISRSAELGIFIGDKNQWGKGFATQATGMAMEHAFFDLNLNRLCSMVLADNAKSPHIFAKFGMSQEGVAREAVFKNGEYRDAIHLGILRTDYLQNRP